MAFTLTTRDMDAAAITDFRGPYRWLSNFHLCDIYYNGVMYASTEHAYQAAKLPKQHRAVFTLPGMTCRDAQHLGQQVKLPPDWDKTKLTVMRDVLKIKFAHYDLREQLLATGDRTLIEGNTWGDVFWGVCNGIGQNNLGKLLMETRAACRMDL